MVSLSDPAMAGRICVTTIRPPVAGVHRFIVAVDVEPSTARSHRREIGHVQSIRAALYELLRAPSESVQSAEDLGYRWMGAWSAGARALLRFVDGVLVALRLLFVRVLSVLARIADVVAFVLVMIAVRLRCGYHDEPTDCFFMLSRRYQGLSGSMLAVS